MEAEEMVKEVEMEKKRMVNMRFIRWWRKIIRWNWKWDRRVNKWWRVRWGP